MSKATIKLEFTVGSNVEECFKESIRIAKLLNVSVEFDFNGVSCFTTGNGDPLAGVNSYHYEVSQGKHGLAIA